MRTSRKHDVIVIGTSAGGVEALQRLVAALPVDLPAAVCIVLHQPSSGRSVLPEILSRAGPLRAVAARDGDKLQNGKIYVAPPDFHLMVEDGLLRLVHGPRENYTRPSIDPLFRSVAQEYRGRVVGVILSGLLNDGTGGLWTIKRYGGVAVVQDPHDAAFPTMPQSAIDNVAVDYVLPLDQIAPCLTRLACGTTDNARASNDADESGAAMPESEVVPFDENTAAARDAPSEFDQLPGIVKQYQAEQIDGERHGHSSIFTCPDCGGLLWQANAGHLVQFRCHVGHVYTAEGLADQQKEALERSLWYSIRTLKDRELLLRQLAHVARERGDTDGADRFTQEVAETERHRTVLEQLVGDGEQG